MLEIAAARWVEGKIEGEASGRIAAILAVLAARGLPVSEEARARIEAWKDVITLDRWIARAATSASIDDVFAGLVGRT